MQKEIGKFFVPFSQNLLRLHLLPVSLQRCKSPLLIIGRTKTEDVRKQDAEKYIYRGCNRNIHKITQQGALKFSLFTTQAAIRTIKRVRSKSKIPRFDLYEHITHKLSTKLFCFPSK